MSMPTDECGSNPSQEELRVATLGPCRFNSPLHRSLNLGQGGGAFTPDASRVLNQIDFLEGELPPMLAFERAGPREKIFFDPKQTRAAIVTCGGLCPGMNDVIRSLYYDLKSNYGIAEVLGILFGYSGLNPTKGRPPIVLTDKDVEEIHHDGGTILGTSRGPQEPAIMVEYLRELGVNLLFCVGGDGTQRGAHAIAEEALARKIPLAVVGIPKTIDNDIRFCYRSFGFMSAVAEADLVIDRAHVEAKSVENGVGLVKVMGREAGYIAASATIASGHVNFCLIPELPLDLDGPEGLLAKLKRRLAARGHAVIVVAEGAGQSLLECAGATDASGNRKLTDIGPWLKDKFCSYFAEQRVPVNVRYFDPSYHIRSVSANTADALLCEQLARNAAHAAMAGKTDLLVSNWNNQFVHVPLAVSTGQPKRINPNSDLWSAVLALTGQDRW
ncbi:MAG: ATP-dependent 6-phosphofructokinase [Pirellulales bacterium]